MLLKCHAGCPAEDITAALGLSLRDLFVDKPTERPQIVATYDYRDDAGKLLAQKLRYSDKHFSWRRPVAGGKWEYNRKGVPHRLYVAGELGGVVHICEGEKDADNFHAKIGGCAVSGADGAGPEWEPGAAEPDPLLSLFKPLQSFQEEDARWLVPGWIPEGQIALLAADGGIGKTTLWCHVIAALSSGTTCILAPPRLYQGTG